MGGSSTAWCCFSIFISLVFYLLFAYIYCSRKLNTYIWPKNQLEKSKLRYLQYECNSRFSSSKSKHSQYQMYSSDLIQILLFRNCCTIQFILLKPLKSNSIKFLEETGHCVECKVLTQLWKQYYTTVCLTTFIII